MLWLVWVVGAPRPPPQLCSEPLAVLAAWTCSNIINIYLQIPVALGIRTFLGVTNVAFLPIHHVQSPPKFIL